MPRLMFSRSPGSPRVGLLLGGLLAMTTSGVQAGGGFFSLGNGFLAKQMAGATTAVVGDAFAGASNPAKWLAAGNQLDVDLEFFNFNRRIAREGSGTPFDFASDSARTMFFIPEAAFSHRVNERLAWGVTLYGNGGLNTEYHGTTGIPGTNAAPVACGNKPGNFLLGCDKLGVDIGQMVSAPGFAYQVAPGHTVGVAALVALQRFQAYGFQAIAPLSRRPTDLTNRGDDWAFGLGARVGWLGEITPWLTLGAAYSTRVYMEKFSQYEGLIAGGALDLPENFSLGFAVRPTPALTLSFDYQRILYGDVPATGNGVLNTLVDPAAHPLGSRTGSGFNWGNQDNFRFGLAYRVSAAFTVRAGYLYGALAQRDDGMNSVTFNMLAPNPEHSVSAGFTWSVAPAHDVQFAYSRWIAPPYSGPSATALLGVGGRETVEAHVNSFLLGWVWRY